LLRRRIVVLVILVILILVRHHASLIVWTGIVVDGRRRGDARRWTIGRFVFLIIRHVERRWGGARNGEG
jgi:hypothetical protein